MKYRVLLASFLVAPAMLQAAEVTLNADGIPVGDYSTTAFATTDGKLSMTESSGSWSFGGAAPDSYGGSGAAGNANAFDETDGASMTLTFAADAGLRVLGTRWSVGTTVISGFTSDPGVSVTAGNGSASYDSGTGTATLTQPWSGGTVVLYNFANPSASAGQTLDVTFSGAGYQVAVNRIVYEDALMFAPPVITTDLDATYSPAEGLEQTLAVTLDSSVFPAPTYNWEFDDGQGGGFVSVGTDASHTLVGGAATDGTYRVTVTNSQGSATSSDAAVTHVPGTDDGREAIAINFNASGGENPNVALSPAMYAGAPGFSQNNWNTIVPLPNAATIFDETDIATPVAGKLVDSMGVETAAKFSIGCAGIFSVVNNPEDTYGSLFAAYAFANATSETLTVQLSDIPYARFDVVIYPMGYTGNTRGYLSDVVSGLEYAVRTAPRLGTGEAPTWLETNDQSNISNGSNENFPQATHVIFRGMTGTTADFDLFRTVDNIGIAGIQIVNAPDTDGDGMGDAYETSVGLNPADDGTTDMVKEGANGDFDGDGVDNITEHNNGTNPTVKDTDGDGYDDNVETDDGTFDDLATDTGTDPRIADTDGDGVEDGAETNSGTFVNADNAGTNPLGDGDSDGDAYADSYEVLNGPTDPFNAESPGGPNPNGFAIAFNSIGGFVGGPDVEFGPTIYAGAPAVAQKNWNRTIDLANNDVDASGDITKIGSPNAGEIVDSSGTVIGDGASGVEVDFTAGGGAFSSVTDAASPYGRLFNSFIYGAFAGDPESTIELFGIPYANYDVYVYFGSETNNRTGTISSVTAGTTYSFTTQVNNGSPGSYLQTTDTGSGNPNANYAVFAGQTDSSFDVTVTSGVSSMGIYGIQVVEASVAAPLLVLENPAIAAGTFTADFTTNVAGTFIFERSQTLNGDWVPVGSPITVGAGTSQVEDTSSSGTEWFYRVREQ